VGVHTDDRSGWLVKFDANGSVAWERTPGNGALWFDSAMKTEDGYLFTGSGDASQTGGTDGYVLQTDANGTALWDGYYGTQGWDKPWPAVRAHDGGYLLAGQTAGDDGGAKDGWLVRIGAESEANGTTGDGTPGDTTASTASGTDTTDSAIQAGTPTTTDDPGGEGSVPGMGVGAALLALVVALLLARR
jgi:PGF-CTERM protein